MSLYDALFWLMIVLIGLLAFALETGIAVRHRRVVVSSLLATTLACVYMMFILEDKTEFAFEPPAAVKKKKKQGGELVTGEEEDGEPGEASLRSGVGAGDGAGSGAATDGEAARGEVSTAPFNDCDICPRMIVVSPGEFVIGRDGNQGVGGAFDDQGLPLHQKRITFKRHFAIGQLEISVKEYAAFMDASGHRSSSDCRMGEDGARRAGSWRDPGLPQDDTHPVVCVSWNDAQAYVAWLSDRTKQTYRLPSEAEWEFAARAGSELPYAAGSSINPAAANFARLRQGTTPVGTGSRSNPNGLYDVHGNVWEMTEDCWNADVSVSASNGSATRLLGECSRHPIRGGGWESPAEQLRFGVRGAVGGEAASNTVGFRVAREM